MEKVDGVLTYVDYDDIELLEEDKDAFWKDIIVIGKEAFNDVSLNKLTIPSTVKIIGEEAFCCNEDLEEVIIEEGVQIIENSAFEECSSLKKVIIPGSVKYIKSQAFGSCYELEEIVLNEGIEQIESDAFYGCDSLTEIKLPNSVKSIPQRMFYGFSNLKRVILPNEIRVVSLGAFYGCTSLEEIQIHSSVEEIDYIAFRECEKLKSVKLNEGLKVIGIEAFKDCSSLEEINFPKCLEVIGSEAFCNCSKLKKVILNEGIDVIREKAFKNCELEEVYLSKGIKEVNEEAFDYQNFKYLSVLEDGRVLLTNDNSNKNITKSIRIEEIYKVYNDIDLGMFLTDSNKVLSLIESVKINEKKGFVIPGKIIKDYETFEKLKNKNFKLVKNLEKFIPKEILELQIEPLYSLAYNLGVLEDKDVTIQGVSVGEIAYTVLQGAFNKREINALELRSRFQSMKMSGYNKEFLKFMANKDNLSELKKEESNQEGFTTKVYEWFEERRKINIDVNVDSENLPVDEENRYKIKTYQQGQNDTYKVKWKTPTVSLFKKEFENRKFIGVNEDNKHIAEYLEKFHLYDQKHFEKAVEIDNERKKSNISESITDKKVKMDLQDSIDEYKKRIQEKRENILNNLEETCKSQTDIMSQIFTYEMLDKSDVANFCIGFLTSCCATLYGAGAGAQRAMILHKDMQPLAIKNSKGQIIAFGIVYVNRKEGYAVVNNLEMNKKYKDEKIKKLVYDKAIQGIEAFANQYNKENPSIPIKKVTCGLSPNWDALNEYIKENPQSMILKAPNFDEFKYSGSGSWNGDWHKNQYVIWKNDGNNNNLKAKL